MPVALRFVLAALATWRVAFFLVREEGPGGAAAWVRERADRGVFGKLLKCVKCAAMWVAMPLAFFVTSGAARLGVTWLALAGVSALVDEWTRPPFEWREEIER